MTGPVPALPPEPDGHPRPVAEIDEGLRGMLSNGRAVFRGLLAGATLLLMAAVIALAFLYGGDHGQLRAEQRLASRQQAQLAAQQAALQSSCRFWEALTSLPAAPTPPATRPSRVLIVLIASGRDAQAGEHCGPLPAAPADLTHWAQVYNVPVH